MYVSPTAQVKKLLFYRNDTLVYELDAKLDSHSPEMTQYIDVSRFFGEELSIETEPRIDFSLHFADTDEDPEIYHEKYRPIAHFTAKRGWINDPNGLCLYRGRYHLFFQHNPAGADWGNMHWGHAVSSDLVHWEQKEIALYPDELGTVFSGSAVVDFNNVTGLKKNDHDVILLFYTAAGGTSRLSDKRVFTQCIAYSTDGGETFQKYGSNPVIRTITNENRDPKVVFHPVSGKYYAALFLSDYKYALFTSSNLLDWKWQQDIILPEDSECPDFYPLILDGTQEEYWVFSGASDHYLIGTIHQDGCFRPVQTAKRLHYGKNSYAAQTFSGNTDGRTIRLAWNSTGIPSSPFNCAMCFPTEMTLKTVEGEKFLCASPIKEIGLLRQDKINEENVTVSAGMDFSVPLSGKAQEILLTAAVSESSFTISALGLSMEIAPPENMLRCGDCTMPLFIRDHKIRLRILTDTNAIEIFTDEGEAFCCIGHIADYTLDKFTVTTRENSLVIKKITINALKSIWGQEI